MSETYGPGDNTFLIVSTSISLVVCLFIISCQCFFMNKSRDTVINTTNNPVIIEPNNSFNIIIENDIENVENIDCSICLDTEYSTVITLSLCDHKFHKNCLKKLNFCPNCRLGINIT
jgi:hypothetical protein